MQHNRKRVVNKEKSPSSKILSNNLTQQYVRRGEFLRFQWLFDQIPRQIFSL